MRAQRTVFHALPARDSIGNLLDFHWKEFSFIRLMLTSMCDLLAKSKQPMAKRPSGPIDGRDIAKVWNNFEKCVALLGVRRTVVLFNALCHRERKQKKKISEKKNYSKINEEIIFTSKNVGLHKNMPIFQCWKATILKSNEKYQWKYSWK